MKRDRTRLLIKSIALNGDKKAQAELLAEFDGLTAYIDTLQKANEVLLGEVDTLQSWLDKISSPIKVDGDIDYIRRNAIPHLREYHYIATAKTLEQVIVYLDSQSKKPRCVHSNDGGVFCEGETAHCPICNPKPIKFSVNAYWHDIPDGDKWITHTGKVEDCHICHLKPQCEHKNRGETVENFGFYRFWCNDCKEWVRVFKPFYAQCPECRGTRQRIVTYPYLHTYPHNETGTYYRVYECCPRCRGEGIIKEGGK